MSKIQFNTNKNSDLVLLRVTSLGIINNLPCKTKPEQVNLALNLLKDLLDTLDEVDLQTMLNIKIK